MRLVDELLLAEAERLQRLAEILKVLTSTSRIASARRWLRITLASRLAVGSVWPTIRKL